MIKNMRRVFLDTETTGFNPGQIAQLSLIIDEDNREPFGKNFFFEIDYITPSAEETCGRGVEFYKRASGGKRFKDDMLEILEYLKDSTLIAHNLQFDENFISTEFWRQNIMFRPTDRFDTMLYFRDICKIPGKYKRQFKNPKLEELVDYFNINKDKVKKYAEQLFITSDSGSFHDARYDTTSMFVAFQIYKESLNNSTAWRDVFCN